MQMKPETLSSSTSLVEYQDQTSPDLTTQRRFETVVATMASMVKHCETA